MGLFNRKPKVIKDIPGGAWGHMVLVLKYDVDTLTKDYRCVEKHGQVGGAPVLMLRIFRLSDLAAKNIEVTGWETFDHYPEMLLYEGYLDQRNDTVLEKKN